MPKAIKSVLISSLILITFFVQPAFAFLGSPQPTSFTQLQTAKILNFYPDASHITYDYDALNRLTAIKDQAGANIASYQYDALSRRKQLNYANNTGATYEYDVINRLTKIKGLSPQGTVPDFSYTYDKVGNRLSMATPSGTHNYTYDSLYQLKKADYPEGYFATDQTFNYDYLGNRTTATDTSTTNYSSNNLNQYTSVGGASYTYDTNGSLTSDGAFTYAYDYENRLISANKTGTAASYKYDPFGRRIEKTVNTSTTKFLYDGDQVICEYDNSGNLTEKYIYGPGIDEPISITKGGQTYYYNSDGLGSVISLTDSSGSTAESYSYDAFGKTSTTSAIGNRFMFTGREYDTETGLYFYRARYYSPIIGRFMQRDPLGYWADFNLYRYCHNNPVVCIDPWGLEAKISMNNDGSILIEIPITYTGAGASEDVIKKFNSAMRENWSGTFGIYNVQVKVTTPKSGEQGNVIHVPVGNGRAQVVGGSRGTWPSARPGWTAAHEVGHLMGLPDYYNKATGKAFEGWENNIMAVQGGKVEESNISDILENQTSDSTEQEPNDKNK